MAGPIALSERTCTKCGHSKPLGDFAPNGKGYRSRCKECDSERHREHYARCREKIRRGERNPDGVSEKNCTGCATYLEAWRKRRLVVVGGG